ncbi:MAG TPA: response regulator [Chitinophagaceae bacterium]|jgi:CheY-like chemotaxis protein|nr:response regulator [Chitinophagaceae bacterium]
MHRILVIDDDPDIRTVVGILLKKQGYEVETAARKEEVMEKVTAFRPSVILLDVLLSGADGRTICRELKSGEGTRHIPVIIVSAHPGAADKTGTFGADDFIAKPFHSELLIRKIEQHLGAGAL